MSVKEQAQKYQAPEAVALFAMSENVLFDSNEGGWAPVSDGEEE